MMSSTCFETEGSSSGRRLYIQAPKVKDLASRQEKEEEGGGGGEEEERTPSFYVFLRSFFLPFLLKFGKQITQYLYVKSFS